MIPNNSLVRILAPLETHRLGVGNEHEDTESTSCPDCRGTRIVSGRLLGQMDYGLGHVFRPDGLRTFKLSLTSSDTPASARFQACLDCGLLWNRASKEKIRNVIAELGKESTKKALGI